MFIFKFSVFRFTDLIFHTPRATIDRLKYCKYCKKKNKQQTVQPINP